MASVAPARNVPFGPAVTTWNPWPLVTGSERSVVNQVAPPSVERRIPAPPTRSMLFVPSPVPITMIFGFV